MIYKFVLTGFLVLNALHISYAQRDRDFLMTTIRVTTGHMNAYGETSRYLATRGWAYYNLDSLDQAIADYSKAINLDPTNPELKIRRADMFFRKKEFQKSIRDYS